MKFYNRKEEIARLREIQHRSVHNAPQMTVVMGRRGVGKTQLLLKATEGQPTLYFFVAPKSENDLCRDFMEEIKVKLDISMPEEFVYFGRLFEFLMRLSKERPFNLIIDEFQIFFNVAPHVYSDMQHYWDVNKEESKINLLLCGSEHSLMVKIFQNSREPLFGRAISFMKILPFSTSVLKDIFADNYPNYQPEDLLALYAFTGGVPKYVRLLIDAKAYTLNAMIDFIISKDSAFIIEGQNMFIEWFEIEYTNYFSILLAIAQGENTRARIEAVLNKEVGGYLTKLDNDYGLITKKTPIFSKVETKNVRYALEDNFLTFWFRFIYKYEYMLEVGGYEQLKEIVLRDYPTFSGKILERYFRTKFIEQRRLTRMGSYWDRKGENEIDLIAINELKKTAEIIEIKRNAANIDLKLLQEKCTYFLKATGELNGYDIQLVPLSIEDM